MCDAPEWSRRAPEFVVEEAVELRLSRITGATLVPRTAVAYCAPNASRRRARGKSRTAAAGKPAASFPLLERCAEGTRETLRGSAGVPLAQSRGNRLVAAMKGRSPCSISLRERRRTYRGCRGM